MALLSGAWLFYDIQIICAEIIVILRIVSFCQYLLSEEYNIKDVEDDQHGGQQNIEHQMLANIIDQIMKNTLHKGVGY